VETPVPEMHVEIHAGRSRMKRAQESFQRGMLEAGCSAAGIEPNASMAAYAVRELGLDARTTTLRGLLSPQRQ
jgi:hypothetical protein